MDFINAVFVLLKTSTSETSEMPKSLKGTKTNALNAEADRFIIVFLTCDEWL